MISCENIRHPRDPLAEEGPYLDLNVDSALLVVQLVVVVGVHLQVVESKLLLDSLLESQALLERKRIGLGDDRNNIDNIRQLLQDNDVNGLKAV
jgi:hypothetical protein